MGRTLRIVQLVYLVILNQISAVQISDLKVVCGIQNGNSEVNLNNLPPYCTAAATSATDDPTLRGLAAGKKTPFLLYYSGFDYAKWKQYFNSSNNFNFDDYINKQEVDGIIFDNMYDQSSEKGSDSIVNQQIHDFFAKLKKSKKGGIYGLALPKESGLLPQAFDYGLIDPVIDFYVIKTLGYRKCKVRDIMRKTTTNGDMEKSVKALSKSSFKSMNKVLLMVQVYAEGVRYKVAPEPIVFSYSELCHYKGRKLSKTRKYCKDSLKEMYDKGKVCLDFGLLGVYIQSIDLDDFSGSCECNGDDDKNTFPSTSVIASGSQGKKADKLRNCKKFGEP